MKMAKLEIRKAEQDENKCTSFGSHWGARVEKEPTPWTGELVRTDSDLQATCTSGVSEAPCPPCLRHCSLALPVAAWLPRVHASSRPIEFVQPRDCSLRETPKSLENWPLPALFCERDGFTSQKSFHVDELHCTGALAPVVVMSKRLKPFRRHLSPSNLFSTFH
jgi:hypothetical protein